jgi:DNA-3-methyladenine glycosylase II
LIISAQGNRLRRQISTFKLKLITPTILKMALRRSTRIQTTAVAEPIGKIQTSKISSKSTPRVPKKRDKVNGSKQNSSIDDSNDILPPVTPNNKRRKLNDESANNTPLPFTPTPAAIGLMLGKTGAKKRKVTTTNEDPSHAPLLTPNGTILEPTTTTQDHILDNIPSQSKPSSSSSPDTLLDTACAHLISVDPNLAPLIAAHKCTIFSAAELHRPIDPFRSLASGIISQQISGKAAASIQARFIALFPPSALTVPPTSSSDEDPSFSSFPTPAAVAAMPLATLRTAGLSQRKAEYLAGLAQQFADGDLSASMLLSSPDEAVVEKLVAVRGLGKWSVEMFLCFALKRMDVFSLGDLGVQRGVAAYVGRDVKRLRNRGGEGAGGKGKGKWKYISEEEMREVGERFRPYR